MGKINKKVLWVIPVILIIAVLAALNSTSTEVSNMAPSDNETVSGSSADLSFDVDTNSDFRYAVILNNQTVQNLSILEGQGEDLEVETGPLAPGVHNWKVEVYTDSREYVSREQGFRTTEMPEFDEPRFVRVQDFEYSGDEIITRLIISSSASYNAYVNGERVDSGNLDAIGLNEQYRELSIDVSEIGEVQSFQIEASPNYSENEYETLVWPVE